MVLMNLREWSTMSIDQRKVWLKTQSPHTLIQLLIMITDILNETPELDNQLSLLEPSDVVSNARDFTVNTLRDVEYSIVQAIQERV